MENDEWVYFQQNKKSIKEKKDKEKKPSERKKLKHQKSIEKDIVKKLLKKDRWKKMREKRNSQKKEKQFYFSFESPNRFAKKVMEFSKTHFKQKNTKHIHTQKPHQNK